MIKSYETWARQTCGGRCAVPQGLFLCVSGNDRVSAAQCCGARRIFLCFLWCESCAAAIVLWTRCVGRDVASSYDTWGHVCHRCCWLHSWCGVSYCLGANHQHSEFVLSIHCATLPCIRTQTPPSSTSGAVVASTIVSSQQP